MVTKKPEWQPSKYRKDSPPSIVDETSYHNAEEWHEIDSVIKSARKRRSENCQASEEWPLRATKMMLLRPEAAADFRVMKWPAALLVSRTTGGVGLMGAWQQADCGKITPYRIRLLQQELRRQENEFRVNSKAKIHAAKSALASNMGHGSRKAARRAARASTDQAVSAAFGSRVAGSSDDGDA